MKKFLAVFAALILAAVLASAGPKPQSGTILSQTSVACGTKKSKKQDIELLCHQYVVRSGITDYTIRQQKPEEQHIIPLNTPIEFTLDKMRGPIGKGSVRATVEGKLAAEGVISFALVDLADSTPTDAPPS